MPAVNEQAIRDVERNIDEVNKYIGIIGGTDRFDKDPSIGIQIIQANELLTKFKVQIQAISQRCFMKF